MSYLLLQAYPNHSLKAIFEATTDTETYYFMDDKYLICEEEFAKHCDLNGYGVFIVRKLTESEAAWYYNTSQAIISFVNQEVESEF